MPHDFRTAQDYFGGLDLFGSYVWKSFVGDDLCFSILCNLHEVFHF